MASASSSSQGAGVCPASQPPWGGGEKRGSARVRPGLRTVPLHPGLFCNRTFDDYACWPDGLPGSFVNVSCPWYLPWANSGESLPLHMDNLSSSPGGQGWGWSWGRVRAASFPLRQPSPPQKDFRSPYAWSACLSLRGAGGVSGVTWAWGLC